MENFSHIENRIRKARGIAYDQTSKNFNSELFHNWPVRDSKMPNYSRRFEELVISEEHENPNFAKYVTEYLKDVQGEAIGLEIGGTGSAFFAGFPEGFFRQTYGVALFDTRDQNQKQLDEVRHHKVLRSDAFTRKVTAGIRGREEIDTNFKDQRPNLIVIKAEGATYDFSEDPLYLFSELRKNYNFLASPGLLFLQSPKMYNIHSWQVNLEKMKSELNGIEGVNFDFYITSPTSSDNNVFLLVRMNKMQAAPKKFPKI